MEDLSISLIKSLDLDLPTIEMHLGLIAEHAQIFNSLVVDLQIKLDGGEDTLDMLIRLEHLRKELLDDYLAYKSQIHERIRHLQQIEAESSQNVGQNQPQVDNQARVVNEGVGDIVVNQREAKIDSDALASSLVKLQEKAVQ